MNFRDVLYSLNRLGEFSIGVYLMIDSVIRVESPFSISKFAVGTLMVVELIRKMIHPRRIPPPVLNVNGLNERVGIPPDNDNENGELDGNVIWEPLFRDADINALAIFEGGFVFDRESIERLATGSDTHLSNPLNFRGNNLKDCLNIATLLREEDLALIENQFRKIIESKSKTNNTRVVLRQAEVDEIDDVRPNPTENNDLKSIKISACLDEILAQAETKKDKKKALRLNETDVNERHHWQAETNVNEIEGFRQAVMKFTNDKALEQAETLINKDKAIQHGETQIIRNEALENTEKTEDEALEQAEKQINENKALKQSATQLKKDETLSQNETKTTEDETSMEAETEITEDEVLEQVETKIAEDETSMKVETEITEDEVLEQAETKITEDETSMEVETEITEDEVLEQAKTQNSECQALEKIETHTLEGEAFWQTETKLIADETSMESETKFMKYEDSEQFKTLITEDDT